MNELPGIILTPARTSVNTTSLLKMFAVVAHETFGSNSIRLPLNSAEQLFIYRSIEKLLLIRKPLLLSDTYMI